MNILRFIRKRKTYDRLDLESISNLLLSDVVKAAHFRDTEQIQRHRDLLSALSEYLFSRTGT